MHDERNMLLMMKPVRNFSRNFAASSKEGLYGYQ